MDSPGTWSSLVMYVTKYPGTNGALASPLVGSLFELVESFPFWFLELYLKAMMKVVMELTTEWMSCNADERIKNVEGRIRQSKEDET